MALQGREHCRVCVIFEVCARSPTLSRLGTGTMPGKWDSRGIWAGEQDTPYSVIRVPRFFGLNFSSMPTRLPVPQILGLASLEALALCPGQSFRGQGDPSPPHFHPGSILRGRGWLDIYLFAPPGPHNTLLHSVLCPGSQLLWTTSTKLAYLRGSYLVWHMEDNGGQERSSWDEYYPGFFFL